MEGLRKVKLIIMELYRVYLGICGVIFLGLYIGRMEKKTEAIIGIHGADSWRCCLFVGGLELEIKVLG